MIISISDVTRRGIREECHHNSFQHCRLLLLCQAPHSKDRRRRFLSHFLPMPKDTLQRFVVLSWKRTGSNLLCCILHNHPKLIMHNELVNPIEILTYHPKVFQRLD